MAFFGGCMPELAFKDFYSLNNEIYSIFKGCFFFYPFLSFPFLNPGSVMPAFISPNYAVSRTALSIASAT